MLLLELDIIKKRQIDKNNVIKLDANNKDSRKYKVGAIYKSAVYTKKSKSSYLLGLYHLVFLKGYLEKENI